MLFDLLQKRTMQDLNQSVADWKMDFIQVLLNKFLVINGNGNVSPISPVSCFVLVFAYICIELFESSKCNYSVGPYHMLEVTQKLIEYSLGIA